jgi:hypothetical protein
MPKLSADYLESRAHYVEAASQLPEPERSEAMRRLEEIDARMQQLPSGRTTAFGAAAAGILAAIVLAVLVLH